ncbi:MAG TPA: putative sugar O-methyltransferase [Solirubrobacteraceae bacterium]|nr:putative sugar O-methyltransferase [Solirubrobacteraceae bacterium]
MRDADVTLCSRLIESYSSAQADDAPTPEGMWSHDTFQRRQRRLLRALEDRDAPALAALLASMFRADFVLGMAPGSLGVGKPRLATKFACLNALSKLVALAESQGAVQVENPEQGAVAIALANGCEMLVANTEQKLGVSLDFPDVGAMYGIRIADRLISWDTPDQIYAAARLLAATRAYLSAPRRPLRVVEIGGGYGGMAYWLLQMTDLRYAIVDLPAVNVLQGYFLSQALGNSEVSFYGEPAARVAVLPTQALADIELPFDVLANKDSMPEIPEHALLEYLSWAHAGCEGIFYSYNQEAAAPFEGTPQNVVPDVLERIGGFTRLRRDASWLRRGYAEEIYMASPPAAAGVL